jgi:hypothetical protein
MTKRRRVVEPIGDAADLDQVGVDLEESDEAVHMTWIGELPALLPSSMLRQARADPPLGELFGRIQQNVVHRQELLRDLGALVEAARGRGGSWGHIGWCIGTTGEAARRRFG